MRRGLLLLALAGCAAAPVDPPVSFRDRSVPIASRAVFDESRFTGLWHEVARFPGGWSEGCAAAETTFAARDGGGLDVVETCRDAGGDVLRFARGTALPAGLPARYDRDGAAPLWVLWVSEEYDTAVIGTPDGSLGAVLNRDPAISAERLRVAREMLDFNGYDTAALVRTGG